MRGAYDVICKTLTPQGLLCWLAGCDDLGVLVVAPHDIL